MVRGDRDNDSVDSSNMRFGDRRDIKEFGDDDNACCQLQLPRCLLVTTHPVTNPEHFPSNR